ncbi:MAG: hypothetical protein ABIB71_01250 [Candidatus Woesearchaeota archaeon]
MATERKRRIIDGAKKGLELTMDIAIAFGAVKGMHCVTNNILVDIPTVLSSFKAGNYVRGLAKSWYNSEKHPRPSVRQDLLYPIAVYSGIAGLIGLLT